MSSRAKLLRLLAGVQLKQSTTSIKNAHVPPTDGHDGSVRTPSRKKVAISRGSWALDVVPYQKLTNSNAVPENQLQFFNSNRQAAALTPGRERPDVSRLGKPIYPVTELPHIKCSRLSAHLLA